MEQGRPYDETFYKPSVRAHKRRLSQQPQILRPWEEERDQVGDYLLHLRLNQPMTEPRIKKTSKLRHILQHGAIIEEGRKPYLPQLQPEKEMLHLPNLVSLEPPKQSTNQIGMQEQLAKVKRSFSLPLIARPHKDVFHLRKNLGLGDLRQQKIKEIRDCINSQIICMDDFQSLKSKILKI